MTIAMGAVTGVTGACPALALTIDGRKVAVDAKTVYEGGTCDTLRTAPRAGAGGPVQDDGSILALRVKLGDALPSNPSTPPSTPPSGQVTVQGTASDVKASCPTAMLSINGKAVSITAATKWEKGACADLKDGVRAGAIGQAVNGVIVAERAITAPAASTPPSSTPPPQTPPASGLPRVQGVVSALGGTCPAVTLTIGTQKVAMSATTKWEKGTCAVLVNGGMAGAIGPITNGVLQAERAIAQAK